MKFSLFFRREGVIIVALYNTVREIIMKKFRPYCAGFIVLYVLCFLCVGDAVYSLISQAMGTANEYMASFSMFSYLIAILAFFYVKMYAVSKVVITDKTMQMVNPVYIKPAPGAKRASFDQVSSLSAGIVRISGTR